MNAEAETPKLYEHLLALYDSLAAKAASTGNSQPLKFTGSMVAAFRAIGVSQGYYSRLYGMLKELGCIEVVVSGRGGSRESQILLHESPTLEGFEGVNKNYLTKSTPSDKITQRLNQIEGRLGNLDLVDLMLTYQKRLVFVEEQLGELTREVQKFNAPQEKT